MGIGSQVIVDMQDFASLSRVRRGLSARGGVQMRVLARDAKSCARRKILRLYSCTFISANSYSTGSFEHIMVIRSTVFDLTRSSVQSRQWWSMFAVGSSSRSILLSV